MDAGQIAALATAIAGLVTAISAVLAQLGHIHWHLSATKPTQAVTPPAPGAPDKQ